VKTRPAIASIHRKGTFEERLVVDGAIAPRHHRRRSRPAPRSVARVGAVTGVCLRRSRFRSGRRRRAGVARRVHVRPAVRAERRDRSRPRPPWAVHAAVAPPPSTSPVEPGDRGASHVARSERDNRTYSMKDTAILHHESPRKFAAHTAAALRLPVAASPPPGGSRRARPLGDMLRRSGRCAFALPSPKRPTIPPPRRRRMHLTEPPLRETIRIVRARAPAPACSPPTVPRHWPRTSSPRRGSRIRRCADERPRPRGRSAVTTSARERFASPRASRWTRYGRGGRASRARHVDRGLRRDRDGIAQLTTLQSMVLPHASVT